MFTFLASNIFSIFLISLLILLHRLVNMPTLSGTLPRHHPVMSMSGLSMMPHASYIGGPSTSLLGHHTLRRQSSHDMEQSMPKVLARNAANVQFYYGWQAPPTILSPVISSGLPQLSSTGQPSSSASSSSATTVSHTRPKSLTTTSMQPLTVATTDSALTMNRGGENSKGLSSDSGGNRTICF